MKSSAVTKPLKLIINHYSNIIRVYNLSENDLKAPHSDISPCHRGPGSHAILGLRYATLSQGLSVAVQPLFRVPTSRHLHPWMKDRALILALFCCTNGHERALVWIALLRVPRAAGRSGEDGLINNTMLLKWGLSAREIFHKPTGICLPKVPLVMTLLQACLIPPSK